MPQVVDQRFHLRRLAKAFVLTMFRKNAYTPALFVHIQTDVNRLTRKIKFVTSYSWQVSFLGEILWATKL